MNTVFCIQQKAHRNQTFQKMGISFSMIPAYGLTKERITFFCIQKTNSLLCSHKKDKKRAFPYGALNERNLFLPQHFTGQVYESLRRRGKFCRRQGNAKRNGMGRV